MPDHQRMHYPSNPVHLDYKYEKPDEKKTIYEKMFFDNIGNKIEAEKIEKPKNIPAVENRIMSYPQFKTPKTIGAG